MFDAETSAPLKLKILNCAKSTFAPVAMILWKEQPVMKVLILVLLFINATSTLGMYYGVRSIRIFCEYFSY